MDGVDIFFCAVLLMGFVNGQLKPRHHKAADLLLFGGAFFLADLFVEGDSYGILVMAATFLALLFTFLGNWQKKLHLVLVFFSSRELLRFFLIYPSTALVDRQIEEWSADFEMGRISFEQLMESLDNLTTVYSRCFFAALILLWGIFLYCYKKQLSGKIGNVELCYLTLPAVGSLFYCNAWRKAQFLFTSEEEFLGSLDDFSPAIRFLVPGGSLFCLLSIYMAAFLFRRLQESLRHQKENAVYENRIKDMEAYLNEVERAYQDVGGMRHDLKNYVSDMRILAAEGEKEAFTEYLNAVEERMKDAEPSYQTGNAITDAVINRHIRLAKEKELTIECNFDFPKDLKIAAFDMSILLNNALENAVENSDAGGKIKLWSRRQGAMYLLCVENPCRQASVFSGGLPVSQKEDAGHGFGLSNMKQIAEKYGGMLRCQEENGIFTLTVLLCISVTA